MIAYHAEEKKQYTLPRHSVCMGFKFVLTKHAGIK